MGNQEKARERAKRLLWKVTGLGAGIAVLGFLLVGAGSAGGGDSGVIVAVGAVALCVGLAVLIYAAVQWVTYFNAVRR